jgi:hypothetical protein
MAEALSTATETASSVLCVDVVGAGDSRPCALEVNLQRRWVGPDGEVEEHARCGFDYLAQLAPNKC